MRVHLKPPTLPPDLLAEFGEPEQASGPNLRFRLWLSAAGGAFLIVGVLLIAAWLYQWPVANWFSPLIAVAMAVCGLVIVVGLLRLPGIG